MFSIRSQQPLSFLFFNLTQQTQILKIMAVSKSELENALDALEKMLDEVPETDQLRDALDEAAEAYVAGEKAKLDVAKEKVERYRQVLTNRLNAERPNWPREVQDQLDANEYPCNVIDPLYGHEFEIDPDNDLD